MREVCILYVTIVYYMSEMFKRALEWNIWSQRQIIFYVCYIKVMEIATISKAFYIDTHKPILARALAKT